MGKRIRLGLVFDFDESWIGGLYYILNLISALATLPDKEQPFITILSRNKQDFFAAKKTGYKFINYRNPYNFKRSLVEAIIQRFGRFTLKFDLIEKRISNKNIDVIFPATNQLCFSLISRKIYWFPDFQHVYFPGLFSKEELNRRENILANIAGSNADLILSSESSKKDWEILRFSSNTRIHTIPFAVTHPPLDDLDIDSLLTEFGIQKEYFIISNQFWKHKNHLLVLKALDILKKQELDYQFVFTGKLDDSGLDDYVAAIIKYIGENDLTNNVKILGLIDRKKQLKLMKHAKAIIQPSLFEGWSTVIEDAKAMGKTAIVSDIPVHREQLQMSDYFFDPYDEKDLAFKINSFINCPSNVNSMEYDRHIHEFGKQFQRVIQDSK